LGTINKECDKHHLPRKFNPNYFSAIKAFQGERIINAPLHVKGVHVDGDGVFVAPHEEQDQKDGTESQPHCSFVEDLCDNYIHGQSYANV
jgi:hypothetical protein